MGLRQRTHLLPVTGGVSEFLHRGAQHVDLGMSFDIRQLRGEARRVGDVIRVQAGGELRGDRLQPCLGGGPGAEVIGQPHHAGAFGRRDERVNDLVQLIADRAVLHDDDLVRGAGLRGQGLQCRGEFGGVDAVVDGHQGRQARHSCVV